MSTFDIYGVRWEIPACETCETCGQPDNCGDCNHVQLSPEEVESLGGIPLTDSYKWDILTSYKS